MKRMLFIYNPYAGKGKILPKLGEIVDIFVKGGYLVEIYPTQAPRDAVKKASKTSKRFDLVVCSGGDGTLDEVVTGMVKGNKQFSIGYIPVGTTNDYATSLKISKDIIEAAEDIVLGQPYAYDVGRFNGGVFIYIAAFGLFTDVSYATNQNFKKLLGHAAYILQGIKSLTDVKAYKMKVTIEDQVYEDEFIYGMITNSVSVGGFKNLTGSNVELDDGLFEVTFIKKPKSVFELQEIITALLLEEDKTDVIISCKAKHIHVESVQEIAWTLDGEFGGNLKDVVIENEMQRMQIIQNKATDEELLLQFEENAL